MRGGADVRMTGSRLADVGGADAGICEVGPTRVRTRRALASITSVYEVGDTHPARMYRLADGVLQPLDPDLERVRRQDLPPVYHRNGAIYATRVDALRASGELIVEPVAGYVMDARWTVNIDTPADLAVAELVVADWDRLRA